MICSFREFRMPKGLQRKRKHKRRTKPCRKIHQWDIQISWTYRVEFMSHRVLLVELLMEGHLRQLLIQMTWLRPNSQKSKKPLRQRQNNSWSFRTFWAIIMRKRPKQINLQILYSTFKMRQISINLGRTRFMMKYKGMNLTKDQSQLRSLLWLITCRKFSAFSLIV